MFLRNAISNLQIRQFSRYLNKGQQAAIDMKSDLTCYQHVPENIAAISPAPQYMKKQFPTAKDQTHKRNNIYNAERIRTSAITKAANEQRYAAGRLHAHLKIENMKQSIQIIKDKEQESVNKKSNLIRGIPAPEVEIDDQFQLPYDAGYDHIIKAKAELIDS